VTAVPPWTSWDGVQRCEPRALARPGGEAELAATVRAAAGRGERVKAVGRGHSFSDCACTDGTMVDLGAMDRVLDADPASGLVRVQAGITLHALGRELAARGLALENQGDIDAQALGGALATATHGTGVAFPNLAARVEAARLVTASGEVLELAGSGDADPDVLRAARVSLGALGILSEVTLRTVPLFTLHRRDAPRPLDATLDRLDELAEAADHFELFVFPYTRTALTRTSTREPGRPDRARPAPWRRRLQEDVLENRVLGAVCAIGRARPRAVPRINRVIATAMGSSEVRDEAHRVFATARRVRFTETEYALPREHARAAVGGVLRAIEEHRLPVTFPVEVRFAASDDALLSPAHDRPSCYVAVHQVHGMDFAPVLAAAEEVLADLGGRPHWGKRHSLTAAELAPRYPGWDRFGAVRARLDPAGVFASAHTDRTLGPVAQRNVLPSPR
jgi:L-gulonolactone oxidase